MNVTNYIRDKRREDAFLAAGGWEGAFHGIIDELRHEQQEADAMRKMRENLATDPKETLEKQRYFDTLAKPEGLKPPALSSA